MIIPKICYIKCSPYIEEVDFVPIGTLVIYVFLIRYSLFDQLRHIICIMFNYVFMHFNVLYCIVLHCCIVLSKPMETKFLCFIMDQ